MPHRSSQLPHKINEKAIAQVVLMDTQKNYFQFEFNTAYGLPEITLDGTLDNWKKLQDIYMLLCKLHPLKTLGLTRYDLD